MRVGRTSLSAFKFTAKSCLLPLLLAYSAAVANAAQLNVTNEFNDGTPAIADQVNQNFTDVETAVNDNNARIGMVESSVNDADSRIGAVETAISELTDRVSALENGMPADSGISVQTSYGTDLAFLLNTGTLIVPNVPGNQSAPETVGEGRDWHPLPGQNAVGFEVEEDNSTVIFSAKGEATYPYFAAYAYMEVALLIDGAGPVLGASERLTIVTDDNVSSGAADWDLFYATELEAGVHTFSVVVREPFGQNEGSAGPTSISLDGRSTEGYEGLIKTTIIQIAP